jgi:hypothetical protein
MNDRNALRKELSEANLADERSAELVEQYYSDYFLDEQDENHLQRFLFSPLLSVRREAIIALIFSKGVGWLANPCYAQHALVLHLLGVMEDADAQFTGAAALYEMRSHGNEAADTILKSLNASKRWKVVFGDDSLGAGSKG